MARKRMVTRTIKGENLLVLCVHTDTRETEEVNLILTEKFKTEAKRLEHIAAIMSETDTTLKPVAILSSEPVETLYGMTEETFIQYANEMKPRSTINESEDE